MRDRLAEIAARYVRTHEAARVLGISPRTVRRYPAAGQQVTPAGA